MTRYVQIESANEEINFYSRRHIEKKYQKVKNLLKSRFFFVFLPAVFISPPIALAVLFITFIDAYEDFFREVFSDFKKFIKYQAIFEPKMSKEALSIIGYRIDSDEIQEHLNIVSNPAELAKKQKIFQSPSKKHEEVGFGSKMLKTHVGLIGKTGSGKTEGIRSIADDSFEFGGSVVMNEGKSDVKMFREFSVQAKSKKRDTSGYVLNMLKPEKTPETNTINISRMMHPMKTINFLGSLIDPGGGGQERYFFNRGKAMLLPVVQGLYVRDEIKNENIDFEKIQEYTQVENLVKLQVVFYCMSKDLNDLIKNNKYIYNLIKRMTPKENKDFQEIEQLIEFLIDKPHLREDVENSLNMKVSIIKEIYKNTYSIVKSYLVAVWNPFGKYTRAIEKAVYYMMKKEDIIMMSPNYNDVCGIQEYKRVYSRLKSELNKDSTEATKFLKDMKLDIEMDNLTLSNLVKAFTDEKGNVEKQPDNAIQQHSYAMQQWTTLLNLFAKYNHVFGQAKSEIDPKRLLLDNKFLYILLPPLESDADETKILGKIIIMTIKEIAAIALGGEKLSQHKTLENINKDLISPKPFTMVSLDEYGAYPVDGIDLLLAQVRSINISMILGIQDLASLKVDGDKVAPQERALANMTKWILKVEDKETKNWLDSMIGKREVRQTEKKVDITGKMVEGVTTSLKEVEILNKEILMNMDSGCSVIVGGSTEDKIVYMQSFYRGGKVDTVPVRKYVNLDFAA